jgi:hypothetical protein
MTFSAVCIIASWLMPAQLVLMPHPLAYEFPEVLLLVYDQRALISELWKRTLLSHGLSEKLFTETYHRGHVRDHRAQRHIAARRARGAHVTRGRVARHVTAGRVGLADVDTTEHALLTVAGDTTVEPDWLGVVDDLVDYCGVRPSRNKEFKITYRRSSCFACRKRRHQGRWCGCKPRGRKTESRCGDPLPIGRRRCHQWTRWWRRGCTGGRYFLRQ